MFIKIDTKNIMYSENDGKSIQFLDNSYYLNLSQLIQIEFQNCLIDKRIANKNIRLEYQIKLYVLTEEGIWNFMTLFFTRNNYIEFQRIKKIIKKQGK